MTDLQQRAQLVTEMLARAVNEALEHKRRLGQYAVICRNGKPYHLSPDEHRQDFEKYLEAVPDVPPDENDRLE